jgi:hypothetical protein
MQFVAGCVRNLKIMVMKGLKIFAELYLMNSHFSHHNINVTVTKFVNSVYECDPSVVKLCDCDFWALSQNCGKGLLALPCLSVCLHGTTQHPQDRFSWSFIISCFFYLSRKRKFH